MSGYCLECGNNPCICKEIEDFKNKRRNQMEKTTNFTAQQIKPVHQITSKAESVVCDINATIENLSSALFNLEERLKKCQKLGLDLKMNAVEDEKREASSPFVDSLLLIDDKIKTINERINLLEFTIEI